MKSPRRNRFALILLTVAAAALHCRAAARQREHPVCGICQLTAEAAVKSMTDPAPVPAHVCP